MDTIIELSAQWTNPSDVTTVLMVIGGDVVQKALAQCTGTLYAPVCFSFGWVSFAFVALVNVLGDGRLLPPPDYPVKIFNLQSGYVRENKNWVIGRILRDHERSMGQTHGLQRSGVRITVFDAVDRPNPSKTFTNKPWLRALNGHPFPYGWTHLCGYLITVAQLGIAAIPIGREGDWGIMLVTAVGTALALVFGALPQWTVEKLPSRMRSRAVFALTSGNGAKDIMVIRGLGKCWDLEDFAALDSPRNMRTWETFNSLRTVPETGTGRGLTFSSEAELGSGTKSRPSRSSTSASTLGSPRNSLTRALRNFLGVPLGFALTMMVCVAQSVLWLLLLITVAALKANTWYLVAVGGLGMFQNAVLAAMTRPADRRGLFLKHVDEIVTRKVMDGLMDLEAEYGFGLPLVGEFFSAKLQPAEEDWWRGDREEYDEARRKEPNRGIPRSYLPKHRYDRSLSPSPDSGPSDSGRFMEVGGATSASAPTRNPSSPPATEPAVALTPPAMASIRSERTRSVTFDDIDSVVSRSRAKSPSRSNLRAPKGKSPRWVPLTTYSTQSDIPAYPSDRDNVNYSPSSSTTTDGGQERIIEFPLEYLCEESDPDRSTSVEGAKGKGKEKRNPYDDLRPDPIWAAWDETGDM